MADLNHDKLQGYCPHGNNPETCSMCNEEKSNEDNSERLNNIRHSFEGFDDDLAEVFDHEDDFEGAVFNFLVGSNEQPNEILTISVEGAYKYKDSHRLEDPSIDTIIKLGYNAKSNSVTYLLKGEPLVTADEIKLKALIEKYSHLAGTSLA